MCYLKKHRAVTVENGLSIACLDGKTNKVIAYAWVAQLNKTEDDTLIRNEYPHFL